jgi:FecR-like protein
MAGIHHSTPWRRARAQRAGAIALGASLLLAAASGPALSDKVGVAAAVNPDAFSSLSGTPNKQLNIGKSIFYNERINTTNSGLVQVLLVDGSTFTVGPNSDLVIDKFVYDPRKKTGQVVATFSKGAMRFVGGKLSKNEGGVTVNTPAGALAIRGGMFQASLSGNRGVFSFLFGNEMRLGNQRVFEPGYTIDTTSGAPTIRPTTRQDINAVMAALTNSDTSGVGGTGTDTDVDPGSFQQANNDSNSLDQLISDANATQIQDEIQNQIKNQSNNQTPTNTQQQQQQTNNQTPVKTVPLPDELDIRVLTSPDIYLAKDGSSWWQKKTFIRDPGSQGILGGDDKRYRCGESDLCGDDQYKFQVTSDDFNTRADIADGRATGTFGPLIERYYDGESRGFQLAPQGAYDFPIFNTPGVHTVTNAMVWDIGEEGQRIDQRTLVGSAFTGRDGGFFAYQLFETVKGQPDFNDPVLVFGGTNFQKPVGEADKLRWFDLYSDPRQGIQVPFASDYFSPDDLSLASVSPLYMLENSGTPPANINGFDGASIQNVDVISDSIDLPRNPEPTVWVQTSYLVLNGEGDDPTKQQTILVLALGTQNDDGSLTGVRRGMASLPGTLQYEEYKNQGNENAAENGGNVEPTLVTREVTETINLTGNISTLANPDGAHLMGNTIPHMIIGADSTGSHTIFKDEPLHREAFDFSDSDLLGATYHVGEQVKTVDASALAHNPGDFYGYAAGLYQQTVYEEGGYRDEIGMLGNASPDDVHLWFKDDNRLSAYFDLENNGGDGGAQLKFGDWGNSEGHSAFISNSIFAATESSLPSYVSVLDRYEEGYDTHKVKENTTYLVSNGLLNPGTSLCTDCSFMRWGTWGGRLEYKDGEWRSTTTDINLAWFATGEVPTFDDLPTQGTATYLGGTIGNVAAYNPETDSWKTYIAKGNVGMDWDFAQRAGEFKITDFDKTGPYGPLNVSGVLRAPGEPDPTARNHFSGPLAGTLGLTNTQQITGAANGSFVRSGSDITRGIIGNWNARNDVYGATGIFGAARKGAVNPNGTLPTFSVPR